MKAAPLLREHRLYQADWLYRFYGFSRGRDRVEHGRRHARSRDRSETRLGLRNRARFPINVNTAAREELLRIPGWARTIDRIIGPEDIVRFGSTTLRASLRHTVARGRSSSQPTGAQWPSTRPKAYARGWRRRPSNWRHLDQLPVFDQKMFRVALPREDAFEDFRDAARAPIWRGGRAARRDLAGAGWRSARWQGAAGKQRLVQRAGGLCAAC